MKQEIGLDKSSKKFICPGCGKKRFVRYFNYTKQEYFPDPYGRCDRELNCGYHLSIKEFFKTSLSNYEWRPKKIRSKPPTLLDLDVIKASFNNYKENNFIQFLKKLFPEEIIREIIRKYLIGTSYHWPGATIFWQIDNNFKVRSGKIFLYDATTGKRVKRPFNHITWYHKVKRLPDFQLSQCLFGLHLLNEYPQKVISIVESEKTACIMSVLVPETIWMATGALNNINLRLFAPLIDRSIILYPDASVKNRNGLTCFDLWNEKCLHLKNHGFNIVTSSLLQDKTNQNQKKQGFDLADFFISQINPSNFPSSINMNPKKKTIQLESKETHALSVLRKINPLVDDLIETFDLVLPNEI